MGAIYFLGLKVAIFMNDGEDDNVKVQSFKQKLQLLIKKNNHS